MFEAISAFNTVGLSMGITPQLSVMGKWITILLMFFGRVGLLTLAAALTIPRTGAKDFRYAYEDVVVG
jgi:trk system potassium uptake protein TrkH